MGLDLVNPHVTKILLAVEDGDSINRISQKAGGSYGWTHKWIKQLEEIGVIERENGVYVRDEEVQDRFESVAKTVFSRDLELEDAFKGVFQQTSLPENNIRVIKQLIDDYTTS